MIVAAISIPLLDENGKENYHSITLSTNSNSELIKIGQTDFKAIYVDKETLLKSVRLLKTFK